MHGLARESQSRQKWVVLTFPVASRTSTPFLTWLALQEPAASHCCALSLCKFRLKQTTQISRKPGANLKLSWSAGLPDSLHASGASFCSRGGRAKSGLCTPVSTCIDGGSQLKCASQIAYLQAPATVRSCIPRTFEWKNNLKKTKTMLHVSSLL